VVAWTAFPRLTAFSAVSRISASFKATVTAIHVAGSMKGGRKYATCSKGPRNDSSHLRRSSPIVSAAPRELRREDSAVMG